MKNSKLVASVMLLISSKFNDIEPLSVDFFASSSHSTYKQNLINAEKTILEKIDFQMIEESPYVLFVHAFKNEPQNLQRCCEIFEICVLEDWAMLYGWEIISKSVINLIKPTNLKGEDMQTKIRIKDLTGRIKKLVEK